MSLLWETSAVPVPGNTCEVNILLTVTVPCHIRLSAAPTGTGSFAIIVIAVAMICGAQSKFTELNEFVPAECLTRSPAFCLGKYRGINFLLR